MDFARITGIPEGSRTWHASIQEPTRDEAQRTLGAPTNGCAETIVGGAEKQDPIAITNFPGEGALPANITQIVRGNLARTGEFKVLDVSNVSPVPTESNQVNFGEWNQRG